MAATKNKERDQGHAWLTSDTLVTFLFYPAVPAERYIESTKYRGKAYIDPPEVKDDGTLDFAGDLRAFPKPKLTIVSARLMLKLYEFRKHKPFLSPRGLQSYIDSYVQSQVLIQPRVTRDIAAFSITPFAKIGVISFLTSHMYYFLHPQRPNLFRFSFPKNLTSIRFSIDGIRIGGDICMSGMDGETIDTSATAQTLFNEMRRRKIINRPFKAIFPPIRGDNNYSYCQLLVLDFSEMNVHRHSRLEVETIYNGDLSPEKVRKSPLKIIAHKYLNYAPPFLRRRSALHVFHHDWRIRNHQTRRHLGQSPYLKRTAL